jgi:hypothetical protein
LARFPFRQRKARKKVNQDAVFAASPARIAAVLDVLAGA